MGSDETPGDRAIVALPTAITAIVGPGAGEAVGAPVALRSTAEHDEGFGSEPSPLRGAVARFFAAGGTRALAVATPAGDLAPGLRALDTGHFFNLLCIAGPANADVRRAASELCHRRRALFIADPDPDWVRVPATVAAFTAGMALESSALYFPPDATGIGLSAAVAGTIARLDAEGGIGSAPVGHGAALGGIDALANDLDDRESERIAALGVNALRTFGNGEPVIWGARTLANDGEWKYVPVRRTALHVEQSLTRGLQWAAFEPNDEPLWAQVRAAAGAFLLGLWRDGTLLGDTPEQAFFVRCDRGTMTQDDVDAGRLAILVGLAQLRPAEFVVLRLALAAAVPDDASAPPGRRA